jgi:RNA polymerase sigma-70 factor (ECF subfamily)
LDASDQLGGLMKAAQAGDKAAYRALLSEIAPLLRRALRQRFRSTPAADLEDLVQDILLAVHASRATYDPERPFLPWLMTIAKFRSADMARRFARRSANEEPVAEYPETFRDEETNVGEGFGDPEALRAAVAALPGGQRTAIELLKLRELSLKDAAAQSGMTIGALKVATHRATRALRLVLRKDG